MSDPLHLPPRGDASADEPVRAEALAEPPSPTDNSYVLGPAGFIYTTPHKQSRSTVRHPGVLLLTADRAPFELSLRDGQTFEVQALAVAPLVMRSLRAEGCQLLSFNVKPSHRGFAAFRGIGRPGVMPLPREAFAAHDAAFTRLFNAQATLDEAESIFDATIATAITQLPPFEAPDFRVTELIRRLDENPHLSLEDVAEQLGRTLGWVSRVFSAAVGVSLRDYQVWLQQHRALQRLYSDAPLDELARHAGFSSREFSRNFERWFGQPPEFNRDSDRVRVFARDLTPPAGD